MKFYSSISTSYDYIFPYNPMHLFFIEEYTPNIKGARILDIGCSTGSLALKIAEKKALVHAIDTDVEMIELADNKKGEESTYPIFKVMDMLSIASKYKPSAFDHVVCFGNTLVHLSSLADIEDFFKQVHHVLSAEGVFSFQILNYSHILKTKMPQLPLIDNEYVRFERYYSYKEKGYVSFDTQLEIKQAGEQISNSIRLIALELKDVISLLEKAGFKDISYFSNFKSEVYQEDAFSLVVNAKK